MSKEKQKNIEAIYPLSPMQQGMLFHAIMEPDSAAYNEQLFFNLRGNLNMKAFRSACQKIIERHPVLRTAFVYKKSDKMLQVVYKDIEMPIEQLDWQTKSAEQQDIDFKIYLEENRIKGFNLSKAPLVRVGIIRIGPQSYKILWSNHHIILDGWSNPVLLTEIFTYYEAALAIQEIQLPARRPYKDYISWLQKQDQKKAENYWQQKLGDFEEPTLLAGTQKLNQQSEEKSVCLGLRKILSDETSIALKEISRQNQLTTNTLVQAAWAYLLSNYCASNEVVFGVTVSGRPPSLPEVESMVGLFINTLPLRVKINPSMNVLEWLKDIQSQAVELREYEYSSLAQVQKMSGLQGNASLFDSIVVFENYPVDKSLGQQKSSLAVSDFGAYEQTNFPLVLVASEHEKVILELTYMQSIFDTGTIKNLLDQLEIILEQMAKDPLQKLAKIKLLRQQQQDVLITSYNLPTINYEEKVTIIEILEQQAKKIPNAIAVECADSQITYNQLNKKSNKLANALIQNGILPETIVGLSLKRSIDMIVAVFAVLKSGGAYLPIDESLPEQRRNFIIDDSNLRFLITNRPKENLSNKDDIRIIDINSNESNEFPDNNPNISINPENLAYVIYTSGSTGQPKGTQITHKGLNHYLNWCKKAYPLESGNGSLLHSTLSFDATVTSLFTPILTGKCITLIEETNDLEALASTLLSKKDFNIVKITPAHLEMLANQIPPDRATGLTKAFIIGGENLTAEHIKFWQKNAPDTLLFNEYGPTETVVGCVVSEAHDWHGTGSVPIGKSIHNSPVFVLDSNLNPTPTGVIGELYISGNGLARGYFNRPDLTAERFIPNPFATKQDERLYKTGDRVKILPGGLLEFIERIDDQVKIRGFRIELGEIEQVMRNIDEVKECLALASKDANGELRITAYFIPVDSSDSELRTISNKLKQSLPDYMIPSFFVELEAFPLTAQGKIDKRALPAANIEGLVKKNIFEAPKTTTEQTLAVLWSNVLAIDIIGTRDNFFDLGGHSILATKLISKVRDAFGVELPLRELFDKPTISETAQLIENLRFKETQLVIPPIQKISNLENIPVSLPQQRLWFIDQFSEGNSIYTIPFSILISGPLDSVVFEQSIRSVIKRHSSLRTTFENKKGIPFQKISSSLYFDLKITDLSSRDIKSSREKAAEHAHQITNSKFNLEKGPLLKVELFKTTDEEFVLVAVMHHIISDGWSMNIMVHEVLSFYKTLIQKKPVDDILPELEIQYADFATWQQNWLQGEVLEKQVSYWKNHLGTNPAVLELNTDFPRPAVQSFSGQELLFETSNDLTAKIKSFGKKEGLTSFITLLSVFQTLMHRYSSQEKILVGSPVAGRHHSETQNLIGFFVNTLVLKADFGNPISFQALTKQVRENMLDAYAHQDIPFEQLVEALQVERDLAHSPLFQVAFIPQDAPTKLPDLENLSFSPFAYDSVVAKYDLSIYMTETADRFLFRLEYNSDLFSSQTMQRLADHFLYLTEQLISEPKTRINLAHLLTPEEESTIKVLNNTEQPFNSDLCVHQRFENIVTKDSASTALQFNNKQMSYGELNEKANQLAHTLLERKISPDNIVGICMERSFDMVVSMIAVLKAGGAYLPLDPGYPVERLNFMINDSGLKFLLLDDKTAKIEKLDCITEKTLNASDLHIYDTNKSSNPDVSMDPANLAYVIYTSGSTGKPKGTLLAHTGLVNLANEQNKAFSITQNSKILQFASLSFDAATWEMVMALLNGAALHLVEREVVASGESLIKTLREEKISTITLPPSLLAVLPETELPDLKTIITAGEKCPAELVKHWQPGRQMVNAYGPTETSVCASIYNGDATQLIDPPIGKNIGNFQLHILDKNLMPVPIGISGELCISGVGLARGYLNKAKITAEKFIPNPFSKEQGSRLYRSGDLVKRLDDGNIEFLGRIDQQVKLRGFRIELGEIEASIHGINDIKDVTVMVREDNPSDQRLVAYLVSEQSIDINLLRSNLSNSLPDYMVPSAFVVLEEMPLTPNGKINYKALPAPEQDRSALSKEYEAPRNKSEEKLAQIIMELLHLKKVGIHDNFFELGGHSLLATQFISRIREEFDVELPLRKIFETPTVLAIAEALLSPEAIQADKDEPGIEAVERGETELSELLGELENMSEEEVKALLAEDNNDSDVERESND